MTPKQRSDHQKRRLYPRTTLNIPAQVIDKTDKSFQIQILEVSVGGFRMLSPEYFQVGSGARVQFLMMNRSFNLDFEVVWSAKLEEHNQNLVGTRFINVPFESLKEIAAFVAERSLDLTSIF